MFSLGEAAMCVYTCLGSQLVSVYTEYRGTAAMSGYYWESSHSAHRSPWAQPSHKIRSGVGGDGQLGLDLTQLRS